MEKKKLEQFREELKSPVFSVSTSKNYYASVSAFLKHFKNKNSAKDISLLEIENYLLLGDNLNTRASKLNAIKCYYKLCEEGFLDFSKFDKPKRIKPVPLGIEQKILLDKIEDIDNRKHKALLALAFSTGMKLGEILNLALEDISFEKQLIYVRNRQGKVERTIEMTSKLKAILERYLKKYCPTKFLFNGQNKVKYSEKSALSCLKKHIGEEYNFHHLRHSFAYSLLNSGVETKRIQKLLGQKSKKTTKLYEQKSKIKIKLPL